jgi:hypothetical protein
MPVLLILDSALHNGKSPAADFADCQRKSTIVVSSTATGQAGKEAEILKAMFKHSGVLAAFGGIDCDGLCVLVSRVYPEVRELKSGDRIWNAGSRRSILQL